MKKYSLVIFTLLLLIVACQSLPATSEPASQATELPATDTAVSTQPATPAGIPSTEPVPTTETNELETAGSPSISRSVTAPPHDAVFVNNSGPILADLSEGWTRVEPGGDTRCAHNTNYAYYVKPGSVNKLLLYFEGGGGCWDAVSCGPGSTFYDPDVGPDEDPTRRAGIFELDHANNPFRDYYAVYIPACNGDVHWGNTVQDYPTDTGNDLTIYHRGFVNAAAALDWAYRNINNPESIFVTGCSAGSVGSRVHVPYVIEQYPAAHVTQLGDSLAFVFGRPVNIGTETAYESYNTFPDWIPALEALKASPLLMADYDIAIANYYSDYTFAQYNTEGDNVQVRFYQAAGGGDAANFAADLATHLTNIHQASPNFRSYTPSSDLHCILPRPQFYSTEVAGVKLTDWVQALADGEPVSSVKCETCQNGTEVTLAE